MSDNTETTETSGVSRRDMLRRSALVGGALVWTAPAVQTLASPAFAAVGSDTPGENQCVYTAFVKYDLSEGFSGSEGAGNASCELEQCAQSNVTVITSPESQFSADLYAGTTKIGSVTASSITETCVTLDFAWMNTACNIDESSSYYIFKDGNDTGDGGSGCEPDDEGVLTDTGVTTSASGDTYRLCSAGGQGGGLSHVNLCICVKCPTT